MLFYDRPQSPASPAEMRGGWPTGLLLARFEAGFGASRGLGTLPTPEPRGQGGQPAGGRWATAWRALGDGLASKATAWRARRRPGGQGDGLAGGRRDGRPVGGPVGPGACGGLRTGQYTGSAQATAWRAQAGGGWSSRAAEQQSSKTPPWRRRDILGVGISGWRAVRPDRTPSRPGSGGFPVAARVGPAPVAGRRQGGQDEGT
jgi:hypothetical protein